MNTYVKMIISLLLILTVSNAHINCSDRTTKKVVNKGVLKFIELQEGKLSSKTETYATLVAAGTTQKTFYLRNRLKGIDEFFQLEYINEETKIQLLNIKKPSCIITKDNAGKQSFYNISSFQDGAENMKDDRPKPLSFEPSDIKIEKITPEHDRLIPCHIIKRDRSFVVTATNVSINIETLFREDLEQLKKIRNEERVLEPWKISVGGLAFQINHSRIFDITQELIDSAQYRPVTTKLDNLQQIDNKTQRIDNNQGSFFKSRLFMGGCLAIITAISLFWLRSLNR